MTLQRHRFTAMGGPCELLLYGADAEAARAFAAAEAEVRRLEARYSRYRDDSVISTLNRSAGDPAGFEPDEETAALLDYAQTAWRESDGAFDLTTGVLRKAWDFKARRVPAQAELDALLPRVGWQRLSWRRPHLSLPEGMELDLGGVVKEYAADRARDLLHAAGWRHGLVELGGDIAIVGPHPDGTPWRVGIRHPRDPEHAIAAVELRAGAIATSGDYERFFEEKGRRYCHLLDPATGWPVEGLASVSVVAAQCLVAGTASTVAMLKGRRPGGDWLESLGLAHLCVAADGTLSGTLPARAPDRSGPITGRAV